MSKSPVFNDEARPGKDDCYLYFSESSLPRISNNPAVFLAGVPDPDGKNGVRLQVPYTHKSSTKKKPARDAVLMWHGKASDMMDINSMSPKEFRSSASLLALKNRPGL